MSTSSGVTCADNLCRNRRKLLALPHARSSCELCGPIMVPGWHCAIEADELRQALKMPERPPDVAPSIWRSACALAIQRKRHENAPQPRDITDARIAAAALILGGLCA